jgi:hypothetical protein
MPVASLIRLGVPSEAPTTMWSRGLRCALNESARASQDIFFVLILLPLDRAEDRVGIQMVDLGTRGLCSQLGQADI